jgi:hypothetical protein
LLDQNEKREREERVKRLAEERAAEKKVSITNVMT